MIGNPVTASILQRANLVPKKEDDQARLSATVDSLVSAAGFQAVKNATSPENLDKITMRYKQSKVFGNGAQGVAGE